MIHFYYGDGKGKTSAAIGAAVRFAGAGGKVLLFQFLKGNGSSERNALEQMENFKVLNGPDQMKFVFQMTQNEKEQMAEYYRNKLKELQSIVKNEEVGMLVLDEAGDSIDCGLLTEQEILDFLQQIMGLTGDREIILTGHQPVQGLMDKCDYITCMEKKRHPYEQRKEARRGIEY